MLQASQVPIGTVNLRNLVCLSENMEVEGEKAKCGGLPTVPPSCSVDNSACIKSAKTERLDDGDCKACKAHTVNADNAKDPGMIKCDRTAIGTRAEQEQASDCASLKPGKQGEPKRNRGQVVLKGEDFWVEVDPEYESDLEPEVRSAVNNEPDSESGSDGRGTEVWDDSTVDKIEVSSDRQELSSSSSSCSTSAVVGSLVHGSVSPSLGKKKRSSRKNPCRKSAFPPESLTANPPSSASSVKLADQEVHKKKSSSSLEKQKAIPCSECDKTFQYKSDMKRHVAAMHKAKSFACTECNKKFGYSYSLKLHIDFVHKGIRNCAHICSECDMRFRHQSQLKVHRDAVHKGIKNFICFECGKAFGYPGSLKTHIDSVHRGPRKYACPDCGLKFSLKSALDKHVDSVHRGLKRFACAECGQQFSSKISMQQHIRVQHRGEKQKHVCLECHKKYSYPCGLKLHIDTIHRGKRKFPCVECGQVFDQNAVLREHVQSVHTS